MDDTPAFRPPALDAILADAAACGFRLSCEERTGSLLAVLAASKPDGLMLELGTGVGAGAAWLLHGMSPDARLLTMAGQPDLLAAPMAWASGLLLGSRARPAAREPRQHADVARPPGGR